MTSTITPATVPASTTSWSDDEPNTDWKKKRKKTMTKTTKTRVCDEAWKQQRKNRCTRFHPWPH